jgi:hypothetical protein
LPVLPFGYCGILHNCESTKKNSKKNSKKNLLEGGEVGWRIVIPMPEALKNAAGNNSFAIGKSKQSRPQLCCGTRLEQSERALHPH